jgi:predicted ATP-grasp superfamily ATP-dependent carboligase
MNWLFFIKAEVIKSPGKKAKAEMFMERPGRRMRIPVILFGGGINGLGVVRNLGRDNIKVWCVVERKEQVVYSGFCSKYYVIPNVEGDKSTLSDFLVKLGKLIDRAVLLSTSDLFSLHLSELKEELADGFCLPLPSQEIVRTLVDKKRFYKSLDRFNVPHPMTFFPESSDDARRISKEIEYPVFVKPVSSQAFAIRFHSKGFVATSAADLINFYALARGHNLDVVFQEVIPGLAAKNVYSIEGYFDKNSVPRAFFASRRLRGWPPTFGNTCLRESIPLSDLAQQLLITRAYLRSINYCGLMEAEWKIDPRDGVFKLLEINARQSMQSILAWACGVDLILIAYLDSIGEETVCNENYKVGIKWHNPTRDLLSVLRRPPSTHELMASLKNIKTWAFFASDDILPWFISNFETAREGTVQILQSML